MAAVVALAMHASGRSTAELPVASVATADLEAEAIGLAPLGDDDALALAAHQGGPRVPSRLLPPPPPPPAAGRRRSRALPAIAVALTGVLGIAAVALVTRAIDTGPTSEHLGPARARPHHVRRGEPRAGLRNPVLHRLLLSPPAYTKASTHEAADVASQDRTELDRYAGELRALGLASGERSICSRRSTRSPMAAPSPSTIRRASG